MSSSTWFALLLVSGCACGPAVLGDLPTGTDSEGASGSASTSGGADATDADGGSTDSGADVPDWQTIAITVPKDIDVLVVIDNSGSMGPRQARLAAALDQLVELLEAPDIAANYRIAFTTTDMGNPWCTETTPEDGAFVASSCAGRLSDFVLDPGGQNLDMSTTACLDFCPHDTIDLLPTTTALDAESKPRPWLEVDEGMTNLPEGVTTREAVRCLAPQGIAGCGFASPLESAYRAIERARTPGDPAYGFTREGAFLKIVLVTDGVDCSSPDDKRAIFLPPDQCYDADGDGDSTDDCTQVFWTDPGAATPTPGVCWNAGVICYGATPEPDGTTSFTSCEAINRDLDGNPGAPADEAVLYPTSRYFDMRDALELEKADWSPLLSGNLFLAIAGVPDGASTSISTSVDPQHNLERGIGPLCTDVDGLGYGSPPVRVHELIPSGGLTSICAEDYAPAFESFVEPLADQIHPACVEGCVADLDPTTEALDFACELRQIVPPADNPTIEPVPQCEQMDDSWILPQDVNVCWWPRADATGSTPDDDDDIDTYCSDQGLNLQISIQRRAGYPAPPATEVQISCTWSGDPAVDCPDMP